MERNFSEEFREGMIPMVPLLVRAKVLYNILDVEYRLPLEPLFLCHFCKMSYICHDFDMNQVNRLALHAFVNAQARQMLGLLIEVLSVLRSDIIAFQDEYLLT